MKREKNSINISINSNDETKSQIVYNNILTNMDKMSLTKDEQLDYLKSRITDLEQEQKSKSQCISLVIIFTIIMVFGLFLLVEDCYALGIIVVMINFFVSIIATYKLSRRNKPETLEKFDEIETIRKFINSKLK